MNNVIMEETCEDNPNVKIETNKNPKHKWKIMKKNFKKLYAQRKL
jgi:hypothetical protein